MILRSLCLAIVVMYTSFSYSEPKLDQVYLYLPDFAMKERIKDQDTFIAYISAVSEQLMTEVGSMKNEPNSSLGVIVTVRPSNESKVWFRHLSGNIDKEVLEGIAKSIESMQAPEVISGIVPFSFALRLGNSTKKFESLPVDESWFKDENESGEITELIGRAWPKTLTKVVN